MTSQHILRHGRPIILKFIELSERELTLSSIYIYVISSRALHSSLRSLPSSKRNGHLFALNDLRIDSSLLKGEITLSLVVKLVYHSRHVLVIRRIG